MHGAESFAFEGVQGPREGLLWRAEGRAVAPLVLACHMGSTHAGSSEAVALARAVSGAGVAHVAAIDGPVHGANSPYPTDREKVIADFRELWVHGSGGIPFALHDWDQALVALGRVPGLRINGFGWYGLSMGTAYGVPFLAGHPAFSAAVLGMWSLAYPHSEEVARCAPAVACRVLFQERQEDDRFTSADQKLMFECFAGTDNIHKAYPGGHVAPGEQQISDAAAFFRDTFSTPPRRQQ